MRDDLRRTLTALAGRGQQREPDEILAAATKTADRHRRMRRAGAGAALLVAVLAVVSVQGNSRKGTDVVVGSDTTTFVPHDTLVRERDRVLVAGLIELAQGTGATTAQAPSFSDEGVQLGLGEDLLVRRQPSEMKDPNSWVLEKEGFRAHTGPFSALKLLADPRPVEISVGPHPHCASPPMPSPSAVAALRRVSVQPSRVDSCLEWFTVDLYVDARGVIHAITLDLWEP